MGLNLGGIWVFKTKQVSLMQSFSEALVYEFAIGMSMRQIKHQHLLVGLNHGLML